MDYIIFKADGSIDKQYLKRYIQQGNDQVDHIFVGHPSVVETDIAQAVFTLPNHTTNTELGVFYPNFPYDADDPFAVMEEDDWQQNYDGDTIPGFVFTLTENQTTYSGILCVAVRIIRTGSILVNYPFVLVINETGVRPDTDTGITVEQLDSYLLNLRNIAMQELLIYTDSALSATSEHPVQNKVVTNALNGKVSQTVGTYRVYGTDDYGNQTTIKYAASVQASAIVQRTADSQIYVPLNPTEQQHVASKYYVDLLISSAYKASGSSNVDTLNALTKAATLNGDVYNLVNGGTLNNSTNSPIGTTTTVRSGDNVVFIWNGGDWYWDVMASFIDLSAYYKNDQNIIPSASDTYDVGSGDYYIANVYANKYYVYDGIYSRTNMFSIFGGSNATKRIVDYNETTGRLRIGHDGTSINEEKLILMGDTYHKTSYRPEVWEGTNVSSDTTHYPIALLKDIQNTLGINEYDPTSTYDVDDLVTVTNRSTTHVAVEIYKCNTAITTPEEWNSAHWTQTSLNEIIANSGGSSITINTTTGSESISDGTNTLNVATRDTAQTFTGKKTFTGNIGLESKIVNSGGYDILKASGTGNRTITLGAGDYSESSIALAARLIYPTIQNTDLGVWYSEQRYHFRNIYLKNGFYKDSSTKALLLPSMASWTTNKTIATTDDCGTKLYKHVIPLPTGFVGNLVAITNDPTPYNDFGDNANGLAQRNDLQNYAINIYIEISGQTSQGSRCPVYNIGWMMDYIGSNGPYSVDFDNYVFTDTVTEL